MKFKLPLTHGTLIRRYKRFLADVRLDDGSVITAHCTNSGSMKSCLKEGAEVYMSPAADPKRKTPFTWEMILIDEKWVGINTSNPNLLVYEAIVNREIPGLDMYDTVKREIKFDESRLDVFAENSLERCVIEVKNVTLREGDKALFPDARTERGLKHLHTLMRLKGEGYRVVMVYVIQRMDVAVFEPARTIDPEYSKTLKLAWSRGVEIFPLQALVTPDEIRLVKQLPFFLD
jgi:sugar fermentation stimulation protein A